MEYLVTMTTQVPDGTSEASVQDVRTRETERSGQLAAHGHLLRLWRPPLKPGEWRTLGLFAAQGDTELENVLASMPLRVWRTDDVTPLLPHPNDPARQTEKAVSRAPRTRGSEFLTTSTVTVPEGVPGEILAATTGPQADRDRELAEQGYLLRLWTLAGPGRELGLWQADDAVGMQANLASLPLYERMNVQTTPLTPHPSDPALTSS
jgi:muconolactone delta-isomerase